MPPSTNRAPASVTSAPIACAVEGEIAFASTNTNSLPAPSTSFATASAACGGHTDSTTSHERASDSTVPASVRRVARALVAGVRPADAHVTT